MAVACSDPSGTAPARPPAGSKHGRLVLVVGPSGAGKDTLLRMAREATKAAERIEFPRRTVTRPASADEDNIEVSPAEFAAAEAAGRFALSWQAHGHSYAIPADIDGALAAGSTIVANVSRSVIDEARGKYPRVCVAYVDALPALRAERLAARGRESAAAIRERLEGDKPYADLRPGDVLIANNSAPEAAAQGLIALILGDDAL